MPQFEFKPQSQLNSWLDGALADRFFIYFVVAWVVPLLLSTVLVVTSFTNLPQEIPLFYSRVWGESQIAAKQYIFLPIVGMLLLGIFNLGLAVSLLQKDKVFSYLLSGTASLVSILGAITIFNIIILVA